MDLSAFKIPPQLEDMKRFPYQCPADVPQRSWSLNLLKQMEAFLKTLKSVFKIQVKNGRKLWTLLQSLNIAPG